MGQAGNPQAQAQMPQQGQPIGLRQFGQMMGGGQPQAAGAQPQVGMAQFGQAIGNLGNSMMGGGQPQVQTQIPKPQQAQSQGGKGGAATGAPQQGQPSALNQFGQNPTQMPQQGQANQPQNVYQQSAQGLTDAMAGARAGMQYQPMNVQASYYNPNTMQGVGNIGMQSVYGQGYNAAQAAGAAPITAQQVSSNQLANTSVSPYMNQYTDEVINRTQADIGRQQEMAQNKLGAQASAAGAFGGSRQGVAEGVMAGEYARLAADTAAEQRQAGFTQAQQAAQADIANRLQADLANQGAGLTAQQSTAANTLQQQLANQGALNQAGQFGAQQGLQAQMANQGMNFSTQQQNMANALQTQQQNMGALNQAGQYNAGQSLQAQMANQNAGLAGVGARLGAAGQLGGFANQGFNMGQAIDQQAWTQGAAQQALNQQLINSAMGQYQGFAGAPNASLGLPLQALGAANMGQQTQTGSYKPGIFDYLSLGAGVAGSYFGG